MGEHLTDGHDAVLSQFLGKRLVGFRQKPNATVGGHWFDDEPLTLVFDDESEMIVAASVWHDSGRLYIESKRYIDLGEVE